MAFEAIDEGFDSPPCLVLLGTDWIRASDIQEYKGLDDKKVSSIRSNARQRSALDANDMLRFLFRLPANFQRRNIFTQVFRKDLIDILLDNPMSVPEIAKLIDETPRDVDDGLKHLLRSLKRSDYRATITPSRCRKCGFTFREDKLRKPGKCPACHGTWLTMPLVGIERKR